jgi:hypothetical protein
LPKCTEKYANDNTEEFVKGNLFAIIMPGTTYRVLKKRGRWKLVEVLSKGKISGAGLQPDMEDVNEVCRTIGWIR